MKLIIWEYGSSFANLVAVYLATQKKRSNFLWGLVGALSGCGLFYHQGFYASAFEYLLYVLFFLWGYKQWAIPYKSLTSYKGLRQLVEPFSYICLLLFILDFKAPIEKLDAYRAFASLGAQFLLVHKDPRCWGIWLWGNALSSLFYASCGFYGIAGLYLVYAILSLEGWKSWHEFELQPAQNGH